jgi:protein phosphatase
MSDVKYKIAAGTNVGLVRKNNEDNFVVCPDLCTSDWRIPQVGSPYADLGKFGALLVVADGMGGANAGEVASAIAVETIQQSFVPERLDEVIADDKSVQEFMKEVVKAADARIFKHSKSDRSTRGMGTTIVMAWVLGDKAYICWCGDSRCYMLNKRRGLMRLSKDHSYVQELVDRGELEPEFAADHPLSNVITRCLGDNENRAVPDTRIFQLHNGDTLLLCSDGLSGLCNDVQLLDLLIKYRDDPFKCKEELISAALNEGGHDNVTVALCNIEMPDNDEQPEEDDPSLPKGLQPNERSNSQTPTLRNNQTVQPVHLPQKTNRSHNWFWLIICMLFVMLLAFFLVRYFSGDEKGATSPMPSSSEDTLKVTTSIQQHSESVPNEEIVKQQDNNNVNVNDIVPENIKQEDNNATEAKKSRGGNS